MSACKCRVQFGLVEFKLYRSAEAEVPDVGDPLIRASGACA